MSPEKKALLYERYPNLYVNPVYIDCEDGWFDLIDGLSSKLEALITEYNGDSKTVLLPEHEGRMTPTQIKEKWGGLCFYMTCATELMFELIEEAESRSFHICEKCGAPGRVRNGGWIWTLCDQHA